MKEWTCRILSALVLAFALIGQPLLGQKTGSKPIAPIVKCADQASRDQDDMCIWIHPTDPSLSIIITSDKFAGLLFVYDLLGKTLQSIRARHPGNIDLRYGIPLGGDKVDVVAVNARDDAKILVYKVDPQTRRLERVDDDGIRTAENYGGTLYRSAKTRKLYFITTSYSGIVEQVELADIGSGRIGGAKIRSWKVGLSEAAVADDEHGKIYIGEESKGVWQVGGEPADPTPGKLIIKRGQNGLVGDVEGLAIYHFPGGGGYLLVSNQGGNDFKIYDRNTHDFIGGFAVKGAPHDSDGLDVCNANLGPQFPMGLFACHTGNGNCPVLLSPWQDIATAVPGVKIDTSWDPRR